VPGSGFRTERRHRSRAGLCSARLAALGLAGLDLWRWLVLRPLGQSGTVRPALSGAAAGLGVGPLAGFAGPPRWQLVPTRILFGGSLHSAALPAG